MPNNAATNGEPVDCFDSVIVIPTFNEAASMPALLESLCRLPRSIDFLVVDDGSKDGTQDLVRNHPAFERRLFLLTRPGKQGLASAYKAGFKWMLERSYDVCLQMDADLSHDPADVPRLLDAVRTGADVSVGSRYVDGIRVMNWPTARLLLSLGAGLYTRRLIGLPLSDPTSGFKAIRRKVLTSLAPDALSAEGYAFQIELHVRAWQSGFNLREVPIVFTERREGQSKMSRRIACEAAWRVLQLAFSERCRRLMHRVEKTTQAFCPSA